MGFSEDYDIIIAGAGPAGAMAACYATLHGAKVLLLERSAKPVIPVRCAEGIDLRGLRNEFKIPSSCISSHISHLKITAPNGDSVRFPNAGKGFILDRHKFEAYLIQKAIKRGVHFVRGWSVQELMHKNGRIEGVIVKNSFETKTLKCSILIAADGIESMLARKAGLDTYLEKSDIEVGYQFLVKATGISPDTLQLFVGKDIAPGSYAWIFPKANGIANVGLAINAGLKHTKSAKQYALDFTHKVLPNAEIIAETGGGIPTAPILSNLSTDGFLVTGDAARLVNPLTGGGIDTALFSGKYAGIIAASAINVKDTSARYLKKYDRIITHSLKPLYIVMSSLAERAKTASDHRLNQIVSIFTKIPEKSRSTRGFLLYLLRKDPWLIFHLSKTYLVRK